MSNPGNSQRQVIDLPPWLLEHCVITSDEWTDSPDSLLLRDPNRPDDMKVRGEDDAEKPAFPQPPASSYEMAPVVFEPLMGLVRRGPPLEDDDDDQSGGTPNNGFSFSQNIVRLQTYMPAAAESTATFMRAVVKHFAKTVGSDLITLTQDDLQDLADTYPKADVRDRCSSCSASTRVFDDDDLPVNYLDVLLRRDTPPRPPRPPPPAGDQDGPPPGVIVSDLTSVDEPPAEEKSASENSDSDEDGSESVASRKVRKESPYTT